MATRREGLADGPDLVSLMAEAKEAMDLTWDEFYDLYRAEGGARKWSQFQDYYRGRTIPNLREYDRIAAASERFLKSRKRKPILQRLPFVFDGPPRGGLPTDTRGINSARRKRPKPRSFAPAA